MAPKRPLYEIRNGTGGFTAVADYLTGLYGLSPSLDRRQVHSWWKRGTLNAAGARFPDPVAETTETDAGVRVSRWFSLEAVAGWFSAGVPGPRGQGWKYPQQEGGERQ